MKKLLFVALVAISLVSCENNDSINQDIDLSDIVLIKPNSEVSKSEAFKIATQTTALRFYNYYLAGGQPSGYSSSSFSVDTLASSLKLKVLDFMDKNGNQNRPLSRAQDIVFQRTFIVKESGDTALFNPYTMKAGKYDKLFSDTIAYIPNSTMIKGLSKIDAAYFDKNYSECKQLFSTEFTYVPITGKEWRRLKLENRN